LNDVALVERLRYNMLSISQLINADLSVFFCKSDSKFLILLVNVCMASLALKIFFKLIFLLLSLSSGVCSLSLLLSSRSSIGG
jgi:hypothetical protein